MSLLMSLKVFQVMNMSNLQALFLFIETIDRQLSHKWFKYRNTAKMFIYVRTCAEKKS